MLHDEQIRHFIHKLPKVRLADNHSLPLMVRNWEAKANEVRKHLNKIDYLLRDLRTLEHAICNQACDFWTYHEITDAFAAQYRRLPSVFKQALPCGIEGVSDVD